MVIESQNSIEKYSGLIVKKGARLMKEEEIEMHIRGRKFLPIEEAESHVEKTGKMDIKAMFTIGVLVENSRVNRSKNGKEFCTMKFTDLVKYDILKVKKVLETKFKDDKDGLKMAEKSYNSNGYKTFKLMVFNELAHKMSNYQIGTIMGIMSYKSMPPTTEYGYTFCIDTNSQLFKIGFSEEYAMCKGSS